MSHFVGIFKVQSRYLSQRKRANYSYTAEDENTKLQKFKLSIKGRFRSAHHNARRISFKFSKFMRNNENLGVIQEDNFIHALWSFNSNKIYFLLIFPLFYITTGFPSLSLLPFPSHVPPTFPPQFTSSLLLCLIKTFQFHEIPFVNFYSQYLCYQSYIQKDVSCAHAFKALFHFLFYYVQFI